MKARLQYWLVRWNGLDARKRGALAAVGGVLLLALVWWLLLAPALRTLRTSDEEHRRLDAQLQRMLRLQNQAQALKSQPRTSRDEALRALEQSVKQGLGASGQLSAQGALAVLTLKGAPAESLAQWLAQLRTETRGAVREAHLRRVAASGKPGASAWDGTLVISLPDS